MLFPRLFSVFLAVFVVTSQTSPRGHAQGALLLQDANGISKVLTPTGHDAVYFARICAASLTKLRRCVPGELGVVIGRYRGIAGYSWLAMPLVPFLYAVEDASAVPSQINREVVQDLRLRCHDAHMMDLGKNVPEGGGMRRGWNQLAGAAYVRRIYAFRFETTEAQDDAFIAKMNADANRSHFSLLFSNCANFTSAVLNFYFPHTFGRHIVPDLGIITPREVAYELAKYARKHPEIHLTVMEIPLIPGYRHSSRVPQGAAEALVVTGYLIPVAFFSPYAAGAAVADYLVWGRYPIRLQHAQVLRPQDISALASSSSPTAGKKSLVAERLSRGDVGPKQR